MVPFKQKQGDKRQGLGFRGFERGGEENVTDRLKPLCGPFEAGLSAQPVQLRGWTQQLHSGGGGHNTEPGLRSRSLRFTAAPKTSALGLRVIPGALTMATADPRKARPEASPRVRWSDDTGCAAQPRHSALFWIVRANVSRQGAPLRPVPRKDAEREYHSCRFLPGQTEKSSD
ncbi:hypothetical protein SKAU_G00393740 [Synaphobranchus kaupii]|uniref:Uncharacterized protein n=1 Tax=Synaphobranchus kaupii TaxID=118154 RepID=A0A9Q1IDW2_SYNKA|nr:hypothetical protein SKAU_G00393740 [Synaphobranchus kaupii]